MLRMTAIADYVPKSKLGDLHIAIIFKMRNLGITYRSIAMTLFLKHGLKLNPTTVERVFNKKILKKRIGDLGL